MFWTVWVQQWHVVDGDVQDAVVLEEDGTTGQCPRAL
jgi:hypothetical protein